MRSGSPFAQVGALVELSPDCRYMAVFAGPSSPAPTHLEVFDVRSGRTVYRSADPEAITDLSWSNGSVTFRVRGLLATIRLP
jgi:hypothetical protein